MKAVRYAGHRTQYTDRLYGTNLNWAPGQVRHLPAHVADRFLRHADVFEVAEEAQATEEDTAAVLAYVAREQREKECAEQLAEAMILEVRAMDKEALSNFAQQKYGQVIDRRRNLDDLRQQVVHMIDQFGVV